MIGKNDKLVFCLLSKRDGCRSVARVISSNRAYTQMVPANMVTLTLYWDRLYLLAIYTARCSIATAAMPTKADLWLRVELHAL